MSDAEVIVQSLKEIEWRIRANRRLREITLGVSLALTFLTLVKIWDFVSPFKASTIRFFISACALVLFGYALWLLLRKKGTLDEAAISIDRTADLNDEIKTAFWFIRHPRPSKWVDRQIQRAAHTVAKIDTRRVYPISIPRTSSAAVVMTLVLVSLNFLPLPWKHNWFPLIVATETAVENAERLNENIQAQNASKAGKFREKGKDRRDFENIYARLQDIAARFQE